MRLSQLRFFLAAGLTFGFSAACFANNVTATREGSLVKIIGDNAANQVLVSQAANGDVTIRGQNGTRVNGIEVVRFRAIQLNAVEILAEGGNDVITLSGIRPTNDLFVNLGSGNDRLNTSTAINVGANCTIEGAEGDDNVRMVLATVGEDLTIDGGIGRLTTTIDRLQCGKTLAVISDNLRDTINITASVVNNLVAVETKGEIDRVTLSGLMATGIVVSTDLGNDNVSLIDVMSADDAGVFTGDGNDTVLIENAEFSKSLTVSVDAGNDNVEAVAVTVALDAVFEGGAGTDTFTDLGVSGGTKFDVKEFEVLLP